MFVFVFFGVVPCVLMQQPFGLSQGLSGLWLMILYLLGAYIKKYELYKNVKLKKWVIIVIVSDILFLMSKLAIEVITNKLFGTPKFGSMFLAYVGPFTIVSAVALLMIFSKVDIKNMLLLKIIQIASPLVLAVYIIHDNVLIRNSFIKDKTACLISNNWIIMIGYVFIIGLSIYIVCSLIEWIRQRLFKRMKVDSISSYIDNKLIDLLK